MGEISSEVKSDREVKWRSGKHSFITLSQVPSGEWTLYTSGATVTAEDLRNIADEMDAVAKEVPEA